MNSNDVVSGLSGVVAGLLFLFGMMIVPMTSWAPPLIKIGVVNWEQVILQYEQYQQKLQELQRKRRRILQFIEEEYGQVNRDRLKGQSDPSQMNQELQRLYQDTLKQHKQRRRRTIENYHQRIEEAIRMEAVEQGYSLILSENEVLYAAEGYTDLTNGVIKRLNTKKPE